MHASTRQATISSPRPPSTQVIGDGTPASCTGDAFVAAVAAGGIITFDCGPDPVTIVLTQTAKVFNDKGTPGFYVIANGPANIVNSQILR